METSHLNQPHFKDAEKAREHLEAIRWPNGPVCPHCGSVSEDHYPLKGKTTRPGLYKCKDCLEPFTVTVGTVFERSKIKLNVWLQAVYLLCSSKKGMSSHQLHRTLGVTYKTAWFMTHRIREAMKGGGITGLMGGGGKIVEADEAYWGIEDGVSKDKIGKQGGKLKSMNKIVSLVERESGQVRSLHVPDVTGENLREILTSNVHQDTHLMTDASPAYNATKREAPFAKHSQVNHSKKEYARGIVTTNTVEGFFSIMKRGLIGTYHHVSSHHLQRYLHEFDFRYNNRETKGRDEQGRVIRTGPNDTERTVAALKGIGGKRLTYRRIGGAAQ